MTRVISPARNPPKSGRIAAIYMILATLSVLFLSVLTPPFQVPDEQQHLFRAYQLSEGHLRGTVQDGIGGGTIPSSMVELAARFLGSRELHLMQGRKIEPTPLRETWRTLDIPLEPDRREFVNFSNMAFYSPLTYLAQTAGIVVGRAAGLGPLGLLYAARIANGLTSSAAVAVAIWLLPAGGTMLLLFALLPMTAFMFASASADTPMTAAALLFTALAFRARVRGQFTRGEFAAAMLAGIVFCSLKPVYAPLLLVGFAAVFRPVTGQRMLLAHLVIVAAAIGATALWLASSTSAMAPSLPDVSVAKQAAWIAAHPLDFATVIWRTVRLFATDWVREVVGKLGWHNLWLPPYMYVPPAVAVVLGLVLPRAPSARLPLLEILWYVLLVASSVFLLLLALYLTWTGIGNGVVGGSQGRYFMPYLAALAIIVEGATPLLGRGGGRLAIGSIVALVAIEAALTCLAVSNAWSVL